MECMECTNIIETTFAGLFTRLGMAGTSDGKEAITGIISTIIITIHNNKCLHTYQREFPRAQKFSSATRICQLKTLAVLSNKAKKSIEIEFSKAIFHIWRYEISQNK